MIRSQNIEIVTKNAKYQVDIDEVGNKLTYIEIVNHTFRRSKNIYDSAADAFDDAVKNICSKGVVLSIDSPSTVELLKPAEIQQVADKYGLNITITHV